MSTNCISVCLPKIPLFSVNGGSQWIGMDTLYVGVVRTHPDGSQEVLWYWEVLKDQLSHFCETVLDGDVGNQITSTISQSIRGFSTQLQFTFTVNFTDGNVRGDSDEVVLPPELFGGVDHFKVIGMQLNARRTNSSLRPQGRPVVPNLKGTTYPKPKVRKGQPRF